MPLSRLAYVLRSWCRQPDVIVDFVREDGHLFVVVENIGTGPAHDLSVTFDPDLRGARGTVDLSSLGLFRHLRFLGPGKKVRAFFDATSAYFDRGAAPTRVTVSIAFANDRGTIFTRQIAHDLRAYRGLGSASASPPGAGTAT